MRASDEEDGAGEKRGQLAFLPERTCAICYQEQNPTSTSESDLLGASGSGGIIGSAQTDITNPYETVPCGCIYCFVCITQKLEAEEGEGWICLRCGELVKQCKPWNGDVLEETRRSSGSGKNVGFAVAGDAEEAEAVADKEVGGSSRSLQDMDADEALQDSSTWSTVERESPDAGTPETETEES